MEDAGASLDSAVSADETPLETVADDASLAPAASSIGEETLDNAEMKQEEEEAYEPELGLEEEVAEQVQPDIASATATLESISASSLDAAIPLPVQPAVPASAASPVPSTSGLFSPLPQREVTVNGKPSQAALAALASTAPSAVSISPPGSLTARKPRMLNTRQAQLRARVDDDPADGDAWLAIIADAQQKGDLEKTRELYEEFFRHFPDAGRQWIAYADLELQHINFDRVEEIFKRCLRDSTSVDLWRFYITYLRRRNPLDSGSPEKAKESRAIIASAFEFSLQHIGIDREAGAIWQEYLTFLRDGDSVGQWEEQQKMDILRRTYQRAVSIPLNNVEEIWGAYNDWENALNKMTSRKFIGEKSAAYTSARLAMRVMKPMLDAVATLDALPRRPDWSHQRDRRLLQDWKTYLAWEESNPLALDDTAVLQQRILYAHRKAIVEMRFYPDIWFSAAAYNRSLGKIEETVALFKSGMSANPTSLLLHFAFAELEESRRNYAEAHAVYDALQAVLAAELERITAEMEQETASAVQVASQMAQTNGMDDEALEEKLDPTAAAQQAVADRFAPRLFSSKSAMATVWINQMRFARRAEGKKQARDVFGRARKSGVLWQVYEAAAMVEYHLNKDPKVASNVFELGLKQFDKDIDFVLRYLEYLINVNDDANARAVFERTIGNFSPDVAARLWERWSRYESGFGDLAAIQKLDERMAEAYPQVKAVARFAERTGMYLGLQELARRDLGIGLSSQGRSRSVSASPPPFRRKRSSSPIPPPRVALRDRADSPDGRGPAKRGRYGPRGRSPSPPAGLPRRPPLLAPSNAPIPRRPVSPPMRHTPPPAEDDGLPEAISFFLRILPSAVSFSSSSGPVLDGNIVVEVIANAASLAATTSRAKPSSYPPPGGDASMRRNTTGVRSLPPRPQALSYGQRF